MSKPFATAIIRPISAFASEPQAVPIIKSRAIGCVASFYAPGWRAMGFRTVEAAVAKAERHPGFVRWAS